MNGLVFNVTMIMVTVGPCTKSFKASKTITDIFVLASTVIKETVLVFLPFGPVVEHASTVMHTVALGPLVLVCTQIVPNYGLLTPNRCMSPPLAYTCLPALLLS